MVVWHTVTTIDGVRAKGLCTCQISLQDRLSIEGGARPRSLVASGAWRLDGRAGTASAAPQLGKEREVLKDGWFDVSDKSI